MGHIPDVETSSRTVVNIRGEGEARTLLFISCNGHANEMISNNNNNNGTELHKSRRRRRFESKIHQLTSSRLIALTVVDTALAVISL